MTVRAVFDANVLISGLVFQGVPGRCLNAVADGRVECITCTAILRDVADKLAEKFHHTDEQLAREVAWLAFHTEAVEPPGQIRGIVRDADDDLVIECALVSNATHIVSGDKDLLELRQYQGVRIVTPAEFLDVVLGGR